MPERKLKGAFPRGEYVDSRMLFLQEDKLYCRFFAKNQLQPIVEGRVISAACGNEMDLEVKWASIPGCLARTFGSRSQDPGELGIGAFCTLFLDARADAKRSRFCPKNYSAEFGAVLLFLGTHNRVSVLNNN